MERSWKDYISLHSNLAGARDAFEKDCETLFREHYKEENVQQVEVKKGDGGIDIFVGEFYNPILVIQCKAFFNDFTSTQITQIKNSFKKSFKSDEYSLKEWILCIPKVLNIEEQKLWSNWKKRMNKDHSIEDDNFINLKNGNELIDLMKKHDLYRTIFKIEELNLLRNHQKELEKTNHKLDNIEKNMYMDVHNEEKEHEILIEIFNKAIERSKTITNEEKKKLASKNSDIWIHTEKKKIPLNFKKSEEQYEVKEYFKLSLLKKEVIREIFESYDNFDLNEISLILFFDYNKCKEDEKDNIKILRKLIDIYTLKKNKNYKSLAIAFVLTFFEDCTIFEKTETEQKDIQTSLF